MTSPFRAHAHERGYVLLGIAIGLVIMGIFMAAAVPVWEHVNQREKEEEMLWRGRQYVRALERYQRKYPGAFPAKMEDLVKGKFLRKIYEDPMSEDREWRILRQNSPEMRAITTPGGSRRQRGGGRSELPQRRLGAPSGLGRRAVTGQALGGIVGVASKSEDEAIRRPGKKEAQFLRTVGEGAQYNEWLFIYVAARNPQQQNPGARGPRQPGQSQRGRPGTGKPGTGGNTPRPPGTPRP